MNVNKLCPFCGGDNFSTADAGLIHEVESVQCINSGCIISGEWFRIDDWNNQPEIDRLTKIERAAKGFIWVTEGGGSCMGKQANYEALRASINHKEG